MPFDALMSMPRARLPSNKIVLNESIAVYIHEKYRFDDNAINLNRIDDITSQSDIHGSDRLAYARRRH